MMRSMYSGVAGLKTHQTKMDVIGNNIANVNTVAYKSQSVTFSELMYQTTQNASGANAATGTAGINARQIGLGVKTGAINTAITTEGASQTTNNPFDIRITGDSFFVVSNGTDTFFTRDGSFYVDGQGNLAMTSNGYNVMGWQVDPETMDVRQETVSALRIMSPENMTYPPEATTKAYIAGILDKNDTNVTSSSGKTMNLQFYDQLGYSYTAKFVIKDTDVEGKYTVELGDIIDSQNKSIAGYNEDGTAKPISTQVPFGTKNTVEEIHTSGLLDGYKLEGNKITGPNNYELDLSVTPADVAKLAQAFGVDSNNAKELAEFEGLTKTLSFTEANGTITSQEFTLVELVYNTTKNNKTPSGSLELTANPIGDMKEIVTDKVAKTETAILTFDATTGKFKNIGGGEESIITLELAGVDPDGRFSNIAIDFSNTTMYNNSGTSTIAATNGDTKGLGSGRKLGQMSGISISNDGKIYASYDNGQSKLLGQIAVAQFSNASGLEKDGDNLYKASQNSGAFDGIGVDIMADGGYMTTGVLEMSNVDLSAEFTEMITTQRGFQANSRIITVSDTLLEELVNLKR